MGLCHLEVYRKNILLDISDFQVLIYFSLIFVSLVFNFFALDANYCTGKKLPGNNYEMKTNKTLQ